MKKRSIITIIFLITLFSSFAQNWKVMNKVERDSIKINRFLRGNKYLGISPGFSVAGQGQSIIDFGFSVEAMFGIFPWNNCLIFINTIYQQTNINYDSLSENWHNYLAGLNFRYYLPERNMKIKFYAEAGVFGGKVNQYRNVDDFIENKSTWMFATSFKAAISIPVHKFNIEVGMRQSIQLLNYEIIDISDHNFFFSASYTF